MMPRYVPDAYYCPSKLHELQILFEKDISNCLFSYNAACRAHGYILDGYFNFRIYENTIHEVCVTKKRQFWNTIAPLSTKEKIIRFINGILGKSDKKDAPKRYIEAETDIRALRFIPMLYPHKTTLHVLICNRITSIQKPKRFLFLARKGVFDTIKYTSQKQVTNATKVTYTICLISSTRLYLYRWVNLNMITIFNPAIYIACLIYANRVLPCKPKATLIMRRRGMHMLLLTMVAFYSLKY